MSMKIIEMDISEVIPYANNPRDNSKAIDAVAASIREFGFKVPVVIDRNNILITGHTRLEAARKLGIQKIPAIRAADLTEAQVKAFRLADNKVGEIATWNEAALARELQALDDLNFDMADFGFPDDELGDDIDGVEDPEVPEDPDPITQPGDIFRLGSHRLMCGDCTHPEDMARLIGGREIDLLLTDPPYNVAYDGSGIGDGYVQHEKIANDEMPPEEYVRFLTKAFQTAGDALKKGGGFYIFYPAWYGYEVHSALRAVPALEAKQNLIWVKNNIVLGRQDYQWQHEPCIYGWKSGAPHYFCDARNESTVIEDRPDIRNLSKPELVMLCRDLMDAAVPGPGTILREDKPQKNDIHPTMKPVKLFARLMANSTKKGAAVLDAFGGSGTTIIAAEQLGRRAYAMELSPRYCDAIIARYEALTGKKAEKTGEAV